MNYSPAKSCRPNILGDAWEQQIDRRACSKLARDARISAEVAQEAVDLRQPEARALIALGGEQRLEHPFQNGRSHARACVANLDPNVGT